MDDPYRPFMGKKGKSWGELDLKEIAGRVAGGRRSPEVEAAARTMVAACQKAGLSADEAKSLLEELYGPVSVAPSGRSRQR